MRKNGCIAASHFMPPQVVAASHHLKQLHLFHLLNSQPQVEPSWLNLSTLPSISRSKTQGRRSQALSLSLWSPTQGQDSSLSISIFIFFFIFIFCLIRNLLRWFDYFWVWGLKNGILMWFLGLRIEDWKMGLMCDPKSPSLISWCDFWVWGLKSPLLVVLMCLVIKKVQERKRKW